MRDAVKKHYIRIGELSYDGLPFPFEHEGHEIEILEYGKIFPQYTPAQKLKVRCKCGKVFETVKGYTVDKNPGGKNKMLQKYIGTKIVFAEPMEKNGQPGYKVVYKDGYESWSPKVAFDEAYKLLSEMDFEL
jgi:hypothetical protein